MMPDVSAPDVVWVYALARDLRPEHFEGVIGVAGERVRLVNGSRLSAVAGTVNAHDFDEERLAERLNDLNGLAAMARTHHSVVDAAARIGPVVPTRLATVYRGDEAVQAMLQERHDDIAAALDRVAGCEEWGVKAFASDTTPPRESPQARSGEPGAGLAYLRRKQAANSAAERDRQTTYASAEALHAELASGSFAAHRHPAQPAELTRDRRPMVLNGAYLVKRGSPFPAAVAARAEGHPDLVVELTGAWPPYSFVAIEKGEGT
jgi:hypothetical protein